MLILWFHFFYLSAIHWLQSFSWDHLRKLGTNLILSLPCLESSKAPLMAHVPDPSVKSRLFLTQLPPSPTLTLSQHGQLSLPLIASTPLPGPLHMQLSAELFLYVLLKAWVKTYDLGSKAFSTQEKPHALGRETSEMFAVIGREVLEDTHCYRLNYYPPPKKVC